MSQSEISVNMHRLRLISPSSSFPSFLSVLTSSRGSLTASELFLCAEPVVFSANESKPICYCVWAVFATHGTESSILISRLKSAPRFMLHDTTRLQLLVPPSTITAASRLHAFDIIISCSASQRGDASVRSGFKRISSWLSSAV